jgi:putative tryptophan/tyrosine transport system substrate-binding protein
MRSIQLGRREFITLIGGAAATWPLAARAQNANKAPRRIAFLPDLVPATLEAWRADMRVLGWTEGRDFIVMQSGIEAGSRNPLDEAAQRVVANKPDLICTGSTAYALAAQRATGSIPIVMLTSGYPVEAGAADSLAKPGRNVTGNTVYAETGVWGKLLQLLREAKPDIKRVGILWTYVMPAFPKEEIEPGYVELNSAARSLNLELHLVEVANSDQVQAALAEIDEGKPGGLLLTSLFTPKAMSVVTQFAVDKGLPTVVDFNWTPLAQPHPLLCYGPIYRELVQTAVASVDKILRGSSPGDLPIQQPRRFELIVSLKTAKAIGLDLPPMLLAQADQVIE